MGTRVITIGYLEDPDIILIALRAVEAVFDFFTQMQVSKVGRGVWKVLRQFAQFLAFNGAFVQYSVRYSVQ